MDTPELEAEVTRLRAENRDLHLQVTDAVTMARSLETLNATLLADARQTTADLREANLRIKAVLDRVRGQ